MGLARLAVGLGGEAPARGEAALSTVGKLPGRNRMVATARHEYPARDSI